MQVKVEKTIKTKTTITVPVDEIEQMAWHKLSEKYPHLNNANVNIEWEVDRYGIFEGAVIVFHSESHEGEA